jgi:hypothetical protein
VITAPERPPHPNGGSTEVDRQECHPTESDNSFALRPSGEERTSVEFRSTENDYDPLQLRHVSKKVALSAVEQNFALSEDVARRASEDAPDNLKQRTVAVHERSLFCHDATGEQHELDRLLANVRSVQREEAAARLPRASQLPSVPSLAPVGDAVWPPRLLESDYLMRSRDTLRGPRTMIKMIFLIVSIIAVPIAYYFWMGGWGPISEPPPEMAFASKFVMPPPKASSSGGSIIARDDDLGASAKGKQSLPSKFSMPLPKSSGQQETTTARDDNPATAAKTEMPSDHPKFSSKLSIPPPKSPFGEETNTAQDDNIRTPVKSDMPSNQSPRTASSFAGETVAMVQPGGSRAQDPPSRTAIHALDPDQIKLLMKQGEQFIAAGDFVTARMAFQRAAEAGDANAAVAVGATYDPTSLAKLGAVGIGADVAKARSWYQKAEKLGSPDARRRLEVLADR